jgi:nucleoside-diphosphate-sugar epimerase
MIEKGCRVLVTGGAGYVGGILCERLLRAGCRVTVLDNLLYGPAPLFHLCHDEAFEFVRGDARDEGTVRRLVAEADVVIPLACVVGAPACDRDPVAARTTNVDAIRMLLALRSPRQFVLFPTTNSGYGTRAGSLHCTEDTPLEPISLYGTTKVDAEKSVLDAPHTVTLRLATVFGMSPRMRTDLLVNFFVLAAVRDRYLVVFEKDFKRNYVHVRDVADGILHSMNNAATMAGSPYNLGLDDANLSKEELAGKVQEHVRDFYVHYAAIGSDPDKRNYIVSNARIRAAGFEARRSLDTGILELLKGYRMFGRMSLGNV